MADYDWYRTTPQQDREIEAARLAQAADGYRIDRGTGRPDKLVCLLCGCDIADREIHSAWCMPGNRDKR